MLIYLLAELAVLYGYQRSEKRRRDQLPKDTSNGLPYAATRRERILAVGLGVITVIAIVWLAIWLY